MPVTPVELGTILSVWAHPDDETYLAGGLMAAARDHGQRVAEEAFVDAAFDPPRTAMAGLPVSGSRRGRGGA